MALSYVKFKHDIKLSSGRSAWSFLEFQASAKIYYPKAGSKLFSKQKEDLDLFLVQMHRLSENIGFTLWGRPVPVEDRAPGRVHPRAISRRGNFGFNLVLCARCADSIWTCVANKTTE